MVLARRAPVWLEGRVYETVGACRARGALQVRDGMLIGRRGATTGSRGAFMNRWAPAGQGAPFYKVLARGVPAWLECCIYETVGRQPGPRGAFTNL